MRLDLTDYDALIAQQYRDSPKFRAMLALILGPIVKLQKVALGMWDAFDLDKATGVQLDIIALWVGATRKVAIPLEGVWFSWDETENEGWDHAMWWDTGDSTTGTSLLPDDLFRQVIRAKIIANSSPRTVESALAVIAAGVSDPSAVWVEDHYDMTYTLHIDRTKLPAVEVALLTAGYLPIRPAGVGQTIVKV